MTKLIFEGNFIVKLLPRYRKMRKNGKIFACGKLNLLDFEQVNVLLPKKIWRNRSGFDSNSKIHYNLDWISHKNRFSLKN